MLASSKSSSSAQSGRLRGEISRAGDEGVGWRWDGEVEAYLASLDIVDTRCVCVVCGCVYWGVG